MLLSFRDHNKSPNDDLYQGPRVNIFSLLIFYKSSNLQRNPKVTLNWKDKYYIQIEYPKKVSKMNGSRLDVTLHRKSTFSHDKLA